MASTALQAGTLIAVLAVLTLTARARRLRAHEKLAVVATATTTFALAVHFPRPGERRPRAVRHHARPVELGTAKIASILATLDPGSLVIPNVSFKDCGFRWSQNGTAGVMSGLLGAALICAFVWGSNYYVGTNNHADNETLWYEATLPGLQEEPSFRGLMLLLLNQAFKDKLLTLLGAPIELGRGRLCRFISAWATAGLGQWSPCVRRADHRPDRRDRFCVAVDPRAHRQPDPADPGAQRFELLGTICSSGRRLLTASASTLLDGRRNSASRDRCAIGCPLNQTLRSAAEGRSSVPSTSTTAVTTAVSPHTRTVCRPGSSSCCS